MSEPAAEQGERDQVVPKGTWAFDEDVTRVFDDMLRRSIPQYEVMRMAVFDVGRRFIRPEGAVVDLGCSRGAALAPFVTAFETNDFLGVEASEPMVQAARARFSGNPRVTILQGDLRGAYPRTPASLVLAVLTLQFIPAEYRQNVVEGAFDSLVRGGAMIVVEKVLGATGRIDRIFVEEYLDLKARNGYSPEDIARKRLSLEGVLVPQTALANESMLAAVGFRPVDCFWRWMNFAGWLAIKS